MKIIYCKTPNSLLTQGLFCLLCAFFLVGCSFDYGIGQDGESDKPDIVMENIEYVRVRKGDLLARFKAEHAERYEKRQIMELRNFSFEQMEDHGDSVNVEGNAGAAAVQLESGDIVFSDGVRINIESEDIFISIAGIEWKDKEKTLHGKPEDEVEIQRSDGTSFTGMGFSADIRSRFWAFSGEVKGIYFEEDDE
jgi:LPS export ABC transporter protein LptC